MENSRLSRSPPPQSHGVVAQAGPNNERNNLTFQGVITSQDGSGAYHDLEDKNRVDYQEIYSQLSGVISTLDETLAAHVEKQEMDFLVAYRVSIAFTLKSPL
jgi:hypothetical protein